MSSTVEDQKPQKRRVRGYSVDPDNEDMDECSIEDDDFDHTCFEEDPLLQSPECADSVIQVPPLPIGSWLVASLLPRYVDQRSVDSTMSVAESTISRFSIYRELREASLDEDYENIKTAMMTEWTYVGACVSEFVVSSFLLVDEIVGCIAHSSCWVRKPSIQINGREILILIFNRLDATIFSTTSGSSSTFSSGFQITPLTQQLIAVSSIFTGLGLAIDAWLMLRYGISSAEKFRVSFQSHPPQSLLIDRLQQNALDLYDTYLSFSVTSRIPIIFTFLSACSLMGFMVIVSASVWPTAAIVLCGVAGVVCTLQYLIYGLHSIWCLGQRVLRVVRIGVVQCCARAFGKSTTPVLATDTASSPPQMVLPPPTHIFITHTTHAPKRPPRNPARNPVRTATK
jgi:hypothetical protein